MPINPAVFSKTRGAVIQSQEWNDGFREVDRLDRDKVNKAGDTIDGALSVRDLTVTDPVAQLTVDNLTVRQNAALPMGAVNPRALGLFEIPLAPVTVQVGGPALRLTIEQFALGGPPPPFPAFFRIAAVSGPASATFTVSEVLAVTPGTPAIVSRGFSLSTAGFARSHSVTLSIVVYSPVDPATFTPILNFPGARL